MTTLSRLEDIRRKAEAQRTVRAEALARASTIEERLHETRAALKSEFQVDSLDDAAKLEERLGAELNKELDAAQAALREAGSD